MNKILLLSLQTRWYVMNKILFQSRWYVMNKILLQPGDMSWIRTLYPENLSSDGLSYIFIIILLPVLHCFDANVFEEQSSTLETRYFELG